VLDTMISRRAWALVLGVLVAVLTAVMLGVSPAGPLVGPLMMIDALALVMLTTALGG